MDSYIFFPYCGTDYSDTLTALPAGLLQLVTLVHVLQLVGAINAITNVKSPLIENAIYSFSFTTLLYTYQYSTRSAIVVSLCILKTGRQ